MNPEHDIFNSKLLLFGEYGLMFDAMALSVPFDRFSAKLDYDIANTYRDSHAEIQKFHAFLSTLEQGRLNYPFDLKALATDLDMGLYFNSRIPQQYGLGSSGALVAALLNRYSLRPLDPDHVSLTLLKADFALLESYFHGKSSGLDPLTCFLNRPLLLDSHQEIHTPSFSLDQSTGVFALIDTHTKGATGPLVQHFIESLEQPVFKSAFESAFIPASNGCIESLLHNDSLTFFYFLKQLIHFELQYFRQMIPHPFNELMEQALDHQVYIKLLGSGGGGYLLAISPRESILREWADTQAIQYLKIG